MTLLPACNPAMIAPAARPAPGRLILGVDAAEQGNAGSPGSGGASPYLELRYQSTRQVS
jgi:hypothetical protein